eukprot:TRINITY_DN6479_c0_g1_i1.p1 TRINITY_DN6479_c0_g1~~TRINITY_DN6479_c0_g1_i1.p1  ORF type:complete len:308 (-),score=43.99 TRINITY_DN6479_c0_g1_i1:239-1162(-)
MTRGTSRLGAETSRHVLPRPSPGCPRERMRLRSRRRLCFRRRRLQERWQERLRSPCQRKQAATVRLTVATQGQFCVLAIAHDFASCFSWMAVCKSVAKVYLFACFLLHCHCDATQENEGSLGPGSAQMERPKVLEALGEYAATYGSNVKGDPLLKHGAALACSACQWSVKRFKSEVASKIRGKLSAAKRRSIFSAGVQAACAEAGFPEQMAVVEKNGNEFYVDFKDAMGSQHGRVSVKRMSPEVRADVVVACKHLLQDAFREALLQQMLDTPKGGRGTDVDLTALLCGPKLANVCDGGSEDEGEEEL